MRKAAILALALGAAPAFGQQDDRDFLTAFLEDSLSDAGREVTITGFAGALASQARIERLTIADADGIWLTLGGVRLDWSRSALLAGALTVSELSAEEIVVARLPRTEDAGLPAPEAAPFRLPDLPLSIAIDRIAADRIELGAAVLGQAVEGRLEASARLAGGEGRVSLDLTRTGDGPAGEIVLEAGFAAATGQLDLALEATEAAGGIVVGLLGVPGAPAASLAVQGRGPLDNHVARLRLTTDGEDRLAGTVTLGLTGDGRQRVLAEVAGNLAPLFLPDYAAFFGDRVGLTVDARRMAAGGLALDRLEIAARTLQLTGRAVISADGLPERLDLAGRVADPGGAAVLLPLPGKPTRIDRAEFALNATQGGDGGWTGRLRVAGLDRADLGLASLGLEGSGRIGRTPAGWTLGGTLRLAAEGLAPADPALAAALGERLAGGVTFHARQGSGVLSLSDLGLAGDGYALDGRLRLEGLADAFRTTGSLTLTATDLSRFAPLAGRPLAGQGRLRLEGFAVPLSGAFDLVADLAASGLRLGIDQADRLLAGASTTRLSVRRDEKGTTLRSFDLAAGGLTVRAGGQIATAGSTLDGALTLTDLGALDPRYGGSLSLTGSFRGTTELGSLAFDGTGRSLRLGSPELDRLLVGETRLSASLALAGGRTRIAAADLANPQFSLLVEAIAEGLGVSARLNDIGLLIPDLQGPLTLSGTAEETGDGHRLALDARGPGGIDARIRGLVATDGSRADLRVTGSGRAALGNLRIAPRAMDGAVGYDLRLNGPFRASALSGRVTLSGGRISDPDLGLSLQDVEALAQIDQGQARLSATARLSTGGRLRVDGPVGLEPPFAARLEIGLDRLRLIDLELYDAILSGSLRLDGPLAGGATLAGAIALAEAELRVPSSGFPSAVALLDLTHVDEPAAVRLTRERAGLIATDPAAVAARPFALDLTVTAPSRVFLRGRGIDAELGGAIRLAGTTAAVVPSGGFSLIRGRLDILGRRLVLSQAEVQLEGSFVPMLQVAAETESDGITSSVRIEGPADVPRVSFASVPERPQEEVVARLLFGRDLGNLSAFQAAQLANAVAVLAGRGGEGIVSRLRKGFGLDDLDLATFDDGTAALTVGRYLTENLYTEIQIEQGGQSRINLNLDLREGITLRGNLGDAGETGVGIFIERDY